MLPINKLVPTNHKGFTLLEVLVAIAVFAMLSLSAYQVLNNVQRSNVQSQEHNDRLREIQQAMVTMNNDFTQIVGRSVRQEGEEPSKQWLKASEYLLDSSSEGILFARDGWQNPDAMFPRGDVTVVGYRIIDDNLERIWYRYPDNNAGVKPLKRVILTKVRQLRLAFFTQKSWKETWDEPEALPEGIKVTLKLNDFGDIDRIYVLPKVEKVESKEKSDQEGNSGSTPDSDAGGGER